MYWRTLGELVKKVGSKTLGRVAGRTIAIGALALGTYEFFSTLNKNMKNEPAFQEMTKYKSELEKWSSVISCIGREPYVERALGSINEGGCINALSKKQTLNLEGLSSKQSTIAPDPELAKELLERAINYTTQTENLAGNKCFEKQKENLIKKLTALNNQIEHPYKHGIDYSPIQRELSELVRSIIQIEAEYNTKVYEYQTKLQKTTPRNAAWSLTTTLTMGIVKKKKRE